ncbi:hypothetical protein GCM10025876_13400 [Demequina litorisediminis]|uniref:PBP domain-containing protein n=1 Tax=Demequina litorisediminis TaxID=1849022 RepID=A0ABQ6ICI1_9MICO|nr:hypothetical protein GCM10025876_13400 [Demequina litorisediminis]
MQISIHVRIKTVKIAYRSGAVVSAAALTFALAACSPSNEAPAESESASAEATSSATADAGTETTALAGNLQGAGASSQESAMDAWRAKFQEANPDVTVGYDPVGSGGGIEQFLSGAVPFAGSDGLLEAGEYEQAVEVCGDGGAYHLPMYISPVAVIFNVEGVTSLNLDAGTIAKIFDGVITSWDDPAIADQNPDVEPARGDHHGRAPLGLVRHVRELHRLPRAGRRRRLGLRGLEGVPRDLRAARRLRRHLGTRRGRHRHPELDRLRRRLACRLAWHRVAEGGRGVRALLGRGRREHRRRVAAVGGRQR